jgi:hypothetical protein
MYNKDLMLLGSNDFKRHLVSFPDLSDEERGEIRCTDLTYLHLYFGVLPEKMTIPLLAKVSRFKEFQIGDKGVFPLYPIVQSSWDGGQLADWLITAKIVQESKRFEITDKLTGRHFLEGCVLGVLGENDLLKVCKKLSWKVKNVASDASELIGDSDELRSGICALFDLNQDANRDLTELFEKDLPSPFGICVRSIH